MIPLLKRAQVFIRLDGTQAIVEIVHQTPQGLPVPAPGPLSLRSWDAASLGESVQTAFTQSSTLSMDPSTRKSTASPVLNASGEPSPRSFESRFVQIDVSGVDPSNVRMELRGRPPQERGLTLQAQIPSNAAPEDLGRLLIRIYEVCRDGRF